MAQSTEASVTALAVLQDERASSEDRLQAFERMLELDHGFWGPGHLAAFVQAYALLTARRTAPSGVSADAIDWELAADEALLALASKAHTIKESPRAWLIGTIRNRVRQAIRDAFEH